PREIPFEIQLRAGRTLRTVANTTRTPGHDYELAAGLLLSEGFIHSRHDVSHMTYCMDERALQEYNLLTVVLHSRHMPQPPQPEQMVVDGVACGVSSQSLLEALQQRALPPIPDGPTISAETLLQMAGQEAGDAHSATATLFTFEGQLRAHRQDVHPRNALDKLLGWGLLNDHLPFHDAFLWLNQRPTFALLQRCAVAGVPLLCSTLPPSSLALSLAARHNITLLHAAGDQITVYSGDQRLQDL
ncbi:MAG: formate dehydrogenase accessory sulfurtransferase FdhD, partial [bacterium]